MSRLVNDVIRGVVLAMAIGTSPSALRAGTYLTDTDVHQVPDIPRPALGVPMKDPVFGTTITRITDASMSSGSQGMVIEYGRYPPLSADKKKVAVVIMGGDDAGASQIREVATGKLLYTLPHDALDTEMHWHPTDPNRLLYRYKNQVRILHTDTGITDTVMTFPDYGYVTTKEEGRPSDDWHYYALLAFPPNTDWSWCDVVVADLVGKKVVARMTNLSSKPDWAGISPSGKYVVVQFVDGSGNRLYDASDLSFIRKLSPDPCHSDFALDANGDDVWVYDVEDDASVAQWGGKAGFAAVRLKDGAQTWLMESHWWWASHISGIGSRANRGWILISTYSSVGADQKPLGREIFWLKMDGSGQVRRIAHHHSDMDYNGNGKDYFAEPHSTTSWDATTVIFVSVWGQPFQRYDLYTVTGDWLDGTPPPPPAVVPPAAPKNLRVK